MADLTTLQRDEQIAEWIKLTEAQSAERVLAQSEPKPRGGRPAAGVRAASRELGIDRNEAQRALKIAAIAPAAKEAAKVAGLENHQGALRQYGDKANAVTEPVCSPGSSNRHSAELQRAIV